MNAPYVTEIPKFLLVALNQLYDMERKLSLHGDAAGLGRNVQRAKEAFFDGGFFYEDPMGQPFSETRTDLEASIAGAGTENLKVTEVIKPVIRYGDTAYSRVIQKGIVVVRSDAPLVPDAAPPNQDQG